MPRRRRAKRPAIGSCTYCGKRGRVTKDHVPPKALFAPPRPCLVTVPACLKCHTQTTKDDEYLVSQVSLRVDSDDNPNSERARNAFLRSMQRFDNLGWQRVVRQVMTPVELQTSTGVILGTAGGYMVQLDRLARVVNRIVRGLYYHHTGDRLSETQVHVLPVDGLDNLDEDGLETFTTFVEIAATAPEQVVGDPETFRYRFQTAQDNPHSTIWLLAIYNRTWFLVVTVPSTVGEAS